MILFCVEADPRNKSSTGSRSSGRRNIFLFRQSRLSHTDNGDDVGNANLLASCASPILNSQSTADVLLCDSSEALQSQGSQVLVTATTDDQDQMVSSDEPLSCFDADLPTRSGKVVHSPVKWNPAACPELGYDTNGSSPAGAASAESRPRSLTKGDVPTFYSLNQSPTPPRRRAAAKNTRAATAKSGRPATKLHLAPQKTVPVAAKSLGVVNSVDAGCDDRRLTFILSGSSTSKSVQSNCGGVRALEDRCDVDVEDIKDQSDEILLDASGFSDVLAANEESDTLVPPPSSSSDFANVTLVGDGFQFTSLDVSSNAVDFTASDQFATGGEKSTYGKGDAAESPAGNVTSLVVTDMELTNVNSTASPAETGNTSDSVPTEAAPLSSTAATTSKSGSQPKSNQSANHRFPVKGRQRTDTEKNNGRSLSSRVESRKVVSPSRQGRSSSSFASGSKTVDVDQRSKAESHHLQNDSREVVVGRQRNSVREHSKNRKTKTVSGSVRLPSSSTEDSVFDVEDDRQTTGSQMLADDDSMEGDAKHAKTDKKHRSSHVSKSFANNKVDVDNEPNDNPASEALPKKVAAYMSKPGKIVFSTTQRKSSESAAAPKSRSKSCSVLPLQSRPRSKQAPASAAATVLALDSPSSAFSYDGTPKEVVVCRPAAMLAARKKFMSMDDSVLVSEPAEKPPVLRQRSLSSEPVTTSPHGIMLVLNDGKRTKPRTTRGKSVHYGASGPIYTPLPPSRSEKPAVPLTPYAKAPESAASSSTECDISTVDVVPESPVFVFTSPLPKETAKAATKARAVFTNTRSEGDNKAAKQDSKVSNYVLV